MLPDELKRIAERLTTEDAGELLAAFFHTRHRVGRLSIQVEARRMDTSSLLETIDFEESQNSFALSL